MATKGNKTLHESNAGTPFRAGACVVLVKTEWNAHIVDALEKGCVKTLKASKSSIEILTVPGAVEISHCIKSFWDHAKYRDDRPEAFVALGCVIRGDTPHFDYVCQSVTQGITTLNLTLPVPVIFGVLTVDNETQAKERVGGMHGHKGEEAAMTALKMIALKDGFRKKR
jgi:6,7-dimethyl-8-ribityllumazine synthase